MIIYSLSVFLLGLTKTNLPKPLQQWPYTFLTHHYEANERVTHHKKSQGFI